MINRHYVLLLATIIAVTLPAASQPLSLTINGLPEGAVITSGEAIGWSVTVPTGTAIMGEIWVDVNQNGIVDPATDRATFIFEMQDGQPGYDVPGDSDEMANGTITFAPFSAGLAPAHWLMVVRNDGSSDTASFVVQPLTSPVASIVGQVSAPVGVDRSFILVEADPEMSNGGMGVFWHALTDVNGNFTIQMGGSPGTLNPWRVRVGEQDLGRLIPLRRDTVVNVGPTPPVVNFEMVIGTILTGIVRDQAMQPLANAYPHVHVSTEMEGSGYWGGRSDEMGRYAFPVPPGTWVLHFTKEGYKDQWWNGKSDRMSADVITVTTQDTIKNLDGVLTKAALITGRVYNYGTPTTAYVVLFTMPGEVQIMSTGTSDNGEYSFTVDPGTYYVRFEKDMEVQYWDHMSMSPGTPIVITGTETITGIDAHFAVGPPPPPPGPHILKVWDVPFDNGGKVFIKFRGVEQYLRDSGGDGDMPFGVEKYTIWRLQKDGPVFVGEVPAAWDSMYTGVVATLVDSNRVDPMIPAGPRWSRYIVKAHFLFNLYVIPSMVDSGYSLDNLAPNVPGGVGSAVAGNDVRILWGRTVEEDLRYYSVYRGTTEGFSIAGMTPIAMTTDASFTDPGGATGTYYYRVTATDFAGNESAPSAPVSSSGTTSAPDLGLMPTTFALGQNYPNPFNPTTTIAFDVPSAVTVRLEVYNALGQVVAELVSGEVGAGRHTVRFDASNLPSGLYMVRMHAGEFVATRKINLIK